MAERSNATTKKSQEAAQNVATLQKRGRRRLVGAIALVLLAVILLPMVFDPEPRPSASLVNVRIPSEEGSKFTPKAGVKPAEPEPRPVEKKAEGKGAVALDGKLIDIASIRQAEAMVAQSERMPVT